MAKREKVILICEDAAIQAHRTESIGPLPVYRGEHFAVTPREADAYVLFGMARKASAEEIAAFDEMEAFKAQAAADEAAKVATDQADAAAELQAAIEAEIAERAALERALTAE
jgi:hypothetical protein